MPRLGQGSDCVAHFEGHEHGLERWVLDWNWIVEDHHYAVTSIAFERAAVLDDLLANGCVVFAEQRDYVFRVGAFSEAGEPAQITEERGYFAAMAFQLLLCPDATIRSATCGGKKRRSLPMRSISPTWSATRCSRCLLSSLSPPLLFSRAVPSAVAYSR